MALSRLADLKSPPSTAESDTEPGTATKTEEQDGTDRTTWGRSALSRVRALSVSGQQHGTVFWKEGAAEKLDGLAELGPRHTLVEVDSAGLGKMLVARPEQNGGVNVASAFAFEPVSVPRPIA